MYLDVDRKQITKVIILTINEILSVSLHRHITEKAVRLAVEDINKMYNPVVDIDDYMVK